MRKFYDQLSPSPERLQFLEVGAAHDDTLDVLVGARRYVLDAAIWAPEVSFVLGDGALPKFQGLTPAPDGAGARLAAIRDNALKERSTLRAQPHAQRKRLARKAAPHAP